MSFNQRAGSIVRQYEALCFEAKLKHDRQARAPLTYTCSALPLAGAPEPAKGQGAFSALRRPLCLLLPWLYFFF